MTGAIHRPQRSTRTACSTRPSTPSADQLLDRPQASLQRRIEQDVVDENSGAASDQLITPESDFV